MLNAFSTHSKEMCITFWKHLIKIVSKYFCRYITVNTDWKSFVWCLFILCKQLRYDKQCLINKHISCNVWSTNIFPANMWPPSDPPNMWPPSLFFYLTPLVQLGLETEWLSSPGHPPYIPRYTRGCPEEGHKRSSPLWRRGVRQSQTVGQEGLARVKLTFIYLFKTISTMAIATKPGKQYPRGYFWCWYT